MGWQSDGFAANEHGQQNAWYESDEGYDEQRRESLHGDMGDTPVHAVAAREYFDRALADFDESSLDTIIVPGSGISMGEPLMRRRERPLTLCIAVLALIACILVTGIFAVTPLGADKASAESPFQVLASSMVLNHQPGYFYYTAEPGDTLDAVARRFHVQVGGIYELNNLYAGEEFAIGTAYKIPTDPNYGKYFQPIDITGGASGNFGHSRFGPNWWNSMAGVSIPSDAPCAPDGGANPLAYHLTSPNWDTYWVRGFIVYGTWVYHTGVDLAGPRGNPIHAAQQGQVIWAGDDTTNGLGYSVKIDHCNHISTVYGHMDKLLVTVGQYVQQGEVIGLEGSTGASYGPHLHFMVEWNNLWVDPMLYYASKYTITHYVS